MFILYINVYMYKKSLYKSQFWTNFCSIRMFGAGPHMGVPYCFWKQSAQ